MTEQECLGIDCLWCANPQCPNMETKETGIFISPYKDITDEIKRDVI